MTWREMTGITPPELRIAVVLALLMSGCAEETEPTPTSALLPCVEASGAPAASTSLEALIWRPERATEDWPGAVRAEPDGCQPLIVDARPGGSPEAITRLYSDPRGDVSRMALARVDIVEVEFRESGCFSGVCVRFDLAVVEPGPIPSPRDEWQAYGIVVDITGDGRPDLRYGIDNAADGYIRHIGDPYSTGDGESTGGHVRIWEADLATGETVATRCCQSGSIDAFWPGEFGPSRASMDVPNTGNVFRFYVWASVISGGEIVSADYAPDFGWLEWPQ